MLIFSKLKGGYWPNCELVAGKCFNAVQDDNQGKDCNMWLAGNSPTKGGGVQASAKKMRNSTMASPPKKSTVPQSHNDQFIQPSPMMH